MVAVRKMDSLAEFVAGDSSSGKRYVGGWPIPVCATELCHIHAQKLCGLSLVLKRQNREIEKQNETFNGMFWWKSFLW